MGPWTRGGSSGRSRGPFPADGERQVLGLVLQVPRDEIRADGSTPVEVYGYAVAEDGTVHDHFGRLARIDFAQADPRGTAKGLSVFGTLQVPPGQ